MSNSPHASLFSVLKNNRHSLSSEESRLHTLIRSLLLRLLSLQIKRGLSTFLSQWHTNASIITHIHKELKQRPPISRNPNSAKTLTPPKPKVLPPKVEIKSVRSADQKFDTKSISPHFGIKKLALTSTLKPGLRLSSTSSHTSRTLTPNADSGMHQSPTAESQEKRTKPEVEKKSFSPLEHHKRPISVPPARDGSKDAPQSDQVSTVADEKKSLNSTGKSLKRTSASRAPDFGTRLFNKAQELETKREDLRKSLEPEFTFTPRLAQNTHKWLNQKSAKSTPIKTREAVEEVAVVSSAALLNTFTQIGKMISPHSKDSIKLKTRVSKGATGPVVPMMPQETLSEEIDAVMTVERWGKKGKPQTMVSPFSIGQSQEDFGQYASFGARSPLRTRTEIEAPKTSPLPSQDRCLLSPSFTKEEEIDEKKILDFAGDDSCDSLLGFPDASE